MKQAIKLVTLRTTEAKRLVWEYHEMSDIVQCQGLKFFGAALRVARVEPVKPEDLWKRFEKIDKTIKSQLDEFELLLRKSLRLPNSALHRVAASPRRQGIRKSERGRHR